MRPPAKLSSGLSWWTGACGLAWRAHFNLLSSLCTTGLLVPLSAARAECERTAIAYLAAVRLDQPKACNGNGIS